MRIKSDMYYSTFTEENTEIKDRKEAFAWQ